MNHETAMFNSPCSLRSSFIRPSSFCIRISRCILLYSLKLPRQDLNDKSHYHALIKIRKLVSSVCWELFSAREAPFGMPAAIYLLALSRFCLFSLPIQLFKLHFMQNNTMILNSHQKASWQKRRKKGRYRGRGSCGGDYEKKFKFNSLKRLCQISFGKIEEVRDREKKRKAERKKNPIKILLTPWSRQTV